MKPCQTHIGGVGLFIDSKFLYEILEVESSFIPGVYESIWAKIQIGKSKFKIIGNVYRPNTAPLANLALAISTHDRIIQNLRSDKRHKNCEIQIVSDFNVNILNFAQHELTNTYLETMFSNNLLPVITRPTRIHHTSCELEILRQNQLDSKDFFLISSVFDLWLQISRGAVAITN